MPDSEQSRLPPNAWMTLYHAYQKYAFFLDSTDPEEALVYTGKAIAIARDQHIDQMPGQLLPLSTLYNNHAWVLWNGIGSEEAIIYYGRAIEVLEGCISQKIGDLNAVRSQLAHVGGALNDIYLETNKEKESIRLRKRLSENGVDL